MSNFTTELATAISTGADIEEFFRQHLEHAINSLLQYELTSFLDYEKWDPIGYNSGNSRNGGYQRKFKTKYGPLNIHVPRDRMGEFKQQTLPPHRQSDESLEQTIIQLYRKGITTREITDLIEKMYGHHYSAGHVSNIGKLVDKDVKAFHSRRVKPNYVVIYCDATWLPVRRDGVAREALHVLVGIDAEGYKEVLDYALYPTESSANYQEMLRSLRPEVSNRWASSSLTGSSGCRMLSPKSTLKPGTRAAGPTCSEMPCIRCVPMTGARSLMS